MTGVRLLHIVSGLGFGTRLLFGTLAIYSLLRGSVTLATGFMAGMFLAEYGLWEVKRHFLNRKDVPAGGPAVDYLFVATVAVMVIGGIGLIFVLLGPEVGEWVLEIQGSGVAQHV